MEAMNDSAALKLKEVVENSTSIALVVEPSADEAVLLAREALKNILEAREKTILLLPERPHDFNQTFQPILENYQIPELTKTLKIKIPKSSPLEQVLYEEEENAFSIILQPKGGALNKEHIIIQEPKPQVDVVFCFSSAQGGSDGDNEKMLERAEQDITMPSREKIVFLVKNERALAEKLYDLAKTLDPVLSSAPGKYRVDEHTLKNHSTATLLYASLVLETENFSTGTTDKTLELGSQLLKLGADQEALRTIMASQKTLAKTQLLGRALARTHIDEQLHASWTFISSKDFEKTNTSPNTTLLLNTLKKIRQTIAEQPLSMLFFETMEGVSVIVYGKNEAVVNPLAKTLGAELQSQYFITQAFKNFSEAELRIRQLLKKSTSDTIEV